MQCLLLSLVLLLTTFLTAKGADKLQVAFCTPEDSQCLLASDGKPDTCFSASHLEENFYFAIFNTVGQPARVDKLVLRTGAGKRTKYNVALASRSEAHDLNCTYLASVDNRTIECPAALENVTSLMIRPEPVPARLHLLEVAAFNANGSRVNFTYCVAPEAPTCQEAMDHRATPDSPAVVSTPAQFPAWYGGLPGTETISVVRIYRPTGGENTFFRVHAAKDCEPVKQVQNPEGTVANGVEVLEFMCSGESVNLLQVWEISSDFLISLCEIEVFGE